MTRNRLEAFSDAVIAIVLTIMVLELKVPHDPSWGALRALWPILLSYLMSFIYIGIYWNNHHHMLHAVQHVNGAVLWANQHLLFWLSLVPFTTGWMGENRFAPLPVAVYGVSLLMPAVAYTILVRALLKLHGTGSQFARALGSDFKGNVSLVLYVIAVLVAIPVPALALLIYAGVATYWLIPDRRFERHA